MGRKGVGLGYRAEHFVRQWLETNGHYVIRSAASKKTDLVAIKDGAAVLVEVKYTSADKPGPYTEAIEKLIQTHQKCGADCLLCIVLKDWTTIWFCPHNPWGWRAVDWSTSNLAPTWIARRAVKMKETKNAHATVSEVTAEERQDDQDAGQQLPLELGSVRWLETGRNHA